MREGNHSENVAAAYGLRSHLDPFITLTGDYRDLDLVAGWSPGSNVHSWITLQASYGNGFLDRLEHRQQYKFNAYRIFTLGRHDVTLFGVGYYGFSYIPGLTPINVPNLHGTIDPRQKDQTHTGLVAANDVWHLTPKQQASDQNGAFYGGIELPMKRRAIGEIDNFQYFAGRTFWLIRRACAGAFPGFVSRCFRKPG